MRRSYSFNPFRSYACSCSFKDKIRQDSENKSMPFYTKARGWQETHGKNDSNKENSGATDTLYNRTPQRVRSCCHKIYRDLVSNGKISIYILSDAPIFEKLYGFLDDFYEMLLKCSIR